MLLKIVSLVIILKIKNTYLYAIKYILSVVALSCDHKQIQRSFKNSIEKFQKYLINNLYKKLKPWRPETI